MNDRIIPHGGKKAVLVGALEFTVRTDETPEALIIVGAKAALDAILGAQETDPVARVRADEHRLYAVRKVVSVYDTPEVTRFAIERIGAYKVGTYPLLEQGRILLEDARCDLDLVERMIVQLVRTGAHALANRIAEKRLDRWLNATELGYAVAYYCDHAQQSDSAESELLRIAGRSNASELPRLQERFAEKRKLVQASVF